MLIELIYNFYINIFLIYYNFYTKIYCFLIGQSCNVDFINKFDLFGKFYVISTFYTNFNQNHIYHEFKPIHSLKYQHITINQSNRIFSEIYIQPIDNTYIKSSFCKINLCTIPTFYKIIDIQKYNPFGIFIYFYIINGLFVEKHILFKPNNISLHSKSSHSKILQSKYYVINCLIKKYYGIKYLLNDEQYIKLLTQ